MAARKATGFADATSFVGATFMSPGAPPRLPLPPVCTRERCARHPGVTSGAPTFFHILAERPDCCVGATFMSPGTPPGLPREPSLVVPVSPTRRTGDADRAIGKTVRATGISVALTVFRVRAAVAARGVRGRPARRSRHAGWRNEGCPDRGFRNRPGGPPRRSR